ncbi:hypothetical protein ACFFRR_000242 [Megaselia abdita]
MGVFEMFLNIFKDINNLSDVNHGRGGGIRRRTGDTKMAIVVILIFSMSGSRHIIGVDAAQRETSKTKELNTNSLSNDKTFVGSNSNSGSSSNSASSVPSSSSPTSTSETNFPISSNGNNNIAVNKKVIEIITDDSKNGPYFDKAASKNVTALLGKTAYLNCRVKNLGNKTLVLQVSWVRHRDIHLLTVGRYTYTSDQRFRAIHQQQTEDWMLQIKYPQHRDSGIYECQVSTTPHMSHYIHLNVVEPSTEIIGAPDLYIESGSTINLTCVILNSPEPPAYIFWNHNNAIINYDSPRGGVSVVTIKGETTTSFLLIKSARPSDSGQYQCNPSNSKSKSVTVHVLNGVSHSVSRGIPSSNAARGTSSSSIVRGTSSFHIPINIIIFYGLHKSISLYTQSSHLQSLRSSIDVILLFNTIITILSKTATTMLQEISIQISTIPHLVKTAKAFSEFEFSHSQILQALSKCKQKVLNVCPTYCEIHTMDIR